MNSYLIIFVSMFGGITTMWIASEIIKRVRNPFINEKEVENIKKKVFKIFDKEIAFLRKREDKERWKLTEMTPGDYSIIETHTRRTINETAKRIFEKIEKNSFKDDLGYRITEEKLKKIKKEFGVDGG